MEKVGQKFWATYQCILNVPLWNDWSKVTYSQVHGSPVPIAQSSFIAKLLVDFWGKICRAHSFGKIQYVGVAELSQEKI